MTKKTISHFYWYSKAEKDYTIIRPLLNCSRSSISLLCEHTKIPVYPDKSNQTIKYSRNRIRKQLLPTIKLFFNAQVEEAVFKLAELISQEQHFLSILLKNTLI